VFPDAICITGEQFLLIFGHGLQQLFFIPANQSHNLFVFLSGIGIILCRIEIAIPELFQNIHNITLLKSVCDVTSDASVLQVAKLHKPGRLFLLKSAV
jgi:hypothetical protein